MDSTPYTKRELDEHFKDIKDDLSEIKIQTRKTNGRVSALENWRWFLAGIGCVIVVLLIPVLITIIK